MNFWIITLFPEMFEGVFGSSMMWKAQEKGLAKFHLVNLREFGLGRRRVVDDTPYGGGDGMLLRVEPIFAAVEDVKKKIDKRESRVVLMTPKGERWNQALAKKLTEDYRVSPCRDLILICGHYEGVDERVLSIVDEEISVGDYVLTGGELPAMTIIDSVVRLIPGVLGGEKSAEIESFADGETLEFPQYTRPEEFAGMEVPEVLLSGNHGEIEKWRKERSEKRKPRG